MNNRLLPSVGVRVLRRLFIPLLVLTPFLFSTIATRAQGAIDYTGTGGRHTIEGRLYFPSGRKADGPGIKITLETASSGTLTLFSDFNGTFSFRNLTAGSYTVVIPATDEYDGVREPVYIDDPGSTNMRTSSLSVSAPPRIFIVPIYLIPKRIKPTAKAAVVDASLANVPKGAVDYYYKALDSIRLNDSKNAVAQLLAALNLYPQFPRALNELGVQYLKLGQLEKAVQTLQVAVRLAPDESAPRLNYGIALLQKKEFSHAEEELRRALQKNDAAATAHMYLGIALLHQQTGDEAVNKSRYAEAGKELQRAITLGGDQVASAHYYLAGVYWRNAQHRLAADELETYLKLTPKAADAERIRATIKDLRRRGGLNWIILVKVISQHFRNVSK